MKLNLYIYHFVWMYYNFILLNILSKPFELAVPVLSNICIAKLQNISPFLGPLMGLSPRAGRTSLEEGNLG